METRIRPLIVKTGACARALKGAVAFFIKAKTPPQGPLVGERRLEDLIALIKENARLRSELQESGCRSKKEVKHFLLELLEVMDAFDHYAASMEKDQAKADELARLWLGYFKYVRRMLWRVLQGFGVTAIQSADGKLNPDYHHVIESRLEPGLQEGTILEETKKGYLWRGEILRKAWVVTARAGCGVADGTKRSEGNG